MREIVPPTAKSISHAKMFIDGVARGREYRSPRPGSAPRSIVSPAMIRARRQLDVVLLRERSGAKDPFLRVKRVWKKLMLFRRLFVIARRISRRLSRYVPEPGNLSPKKALYASLFAGVSFGMVSMSVIQDLKGDEVNAGTAVTVAPVVEETEGEKLAKELSEEKKKYDPNDDLFLQFFSEAEKEEYRGQIEELVKGYPIEDMLPYILEKDRIVAAFLIGIGKKESNWGKRVPVLDGQDCFNYWGYRGVRRLMGTGGHTCFNSRKDAVDTVALRIESLIYSSKIDTPAKMIIWKCGYSCDGHSRESVRKWIADVDMYFKELNQAEGGPGE
ncbi:MAG: hypothetical protein E6Q06_00335 [Candidatus Moraniibacteriota bacterium]|nr:MAG: hypothetical protein E6Q06_00335 [Candidatus Moranbacteria bacterium]